jgi:CDP-diglyceride synthetase
MAVVCAITMGTIMLAVKCVRRRCRELLLPVAPPSRNFYIIGWATVGVLLVLAILPQVWLDPERSYVKPIYAVVAVGLLLVVLADLVYNIFCDVRYGRKFAAYYGSLARTMIPVTALALIIVNVSSRPYLRMRERQLLASDTLMSIDSKGGGFTTVEFRLVQRLKGEIQKAVESLPSGSGK